MFTGEDVFKKVKMLSGGEKVRLSLSKILKKGVNLLVLDEPTNHMDIIGKESLENMLKEYKGTLIFVSHDRFFVNKIADSILSFENGKAVYYPYGYEYYLEKREESGIKEEQKNQKEQEKPKKQAYNNPLKEKDKFSISILKEELGKEEIYSDYVKVGEIQGKIDTLNKEIENYMISWEEFQEQLEKLSKNYSFSST